MARFMTSAQPIRVNATNKTAAKSRKISQTLRLGVVLATFRSRSKRNRQRPPGYVWGSLEKTDPAPRSAGIAHHLSLCAFWHFQSTRKGLSSGDDKPRDPYNAARPRVNWTFLKGSIRELCSREVSAMSGDFVEVSWRSGLAVGLAQEAAKWNQKPKK